MGIGESTVSMRVILVLSVVWLSEGYLNDGLLSISITRHHKGDLFVAQGEKCYKDLCVGLSGGTAVPGGAGDCECRCPPSRPVFRDDLNVCVDDIQECNVVAFASGAASVKRIPFVFLPLKGQIVYPSADIVIPEVESPVCVVSGGQFLGQGGWLNLKNDSGGEQPFRLFRDEGRTYLQWLGESSLRMAMEGRIILVHLMCKDASASVEHRIFTPCIAFRVAGNPSIREVMFSTDVHLKEEHGGSLTVRDYVAIGICSLLLAIVYVASVFLYLHIRKRKQKGNQKGGEDAQLTLGEEGIIKSNPLLQASRHLTGDGHDNAGYVSDSNSCCSDEDQISDLLCLDDEDSSGHQNVQTSAIVHPCDLDYGETALGQDSSNIEKLPEENVSIVETLEVKEHPETVKAMGCANGRRKLYFNPSYFEPDLLKAPPPAAMEFLMKIREVIAIAKHKMSAKKFSPSLLGIPEEDGSTKAESALNVRKEAPAPENPRTVPSEGDKMPGTFHLVPNAFYCPSDVKQRIIRKWLEDVPMMIPQKFSEEGISNKSKPWQVNEGNSSGESNRAPSPRQEKKRPSKKGKAPPLPPQPRAEETKKGLPDTEQVPVESSAPLASPPPPPPPRPPPLPSFPQHPPELPSTQGKDRALPPALPKNLMDAVIQELAGYKKNEKTNPATPEVAAPQNEAKENEEKGEESGQEEKGNVGPQNPTGAQDDHEYEVILLDARPNEGKDLEIYNLPEILSKNDRTEGYSLVSEVYVNDGYSCCSGESPPSSLSADSDKIRYEVMDEKPGRLTIHVNDSPEHYKPPTPESDNFEPDTLDRKPHRSKLVKRINEQNEESERYSNQKFQECCASTNNAETFTDSLERPSIMLKTNGTFKRNSNESLKDFDDLFRNFGWTKVENFGSLREIYEAKSRTQRRRTETTSLIDYANNDTDRTSTLSWSEDRKHKLLHRGIVLHISEEGSRKPKRSPKAVLPPKVPSRPPKSCPSPRSGSSSPVTRSNCTSSSMRSAPGFPVSPRSVSPPVPPPRSVPPSPPPRSASSSPVTTERRKGLSTPPSHSPSNSIRGTRLSPSPPPPPRPPKASVDYSPLLPPRNAKPPLPPKSRGVRHRPPPSKFATRPLPPLPYPRPARDCPSSPVSFKDPETLSTLSGASMDSLNSSDYEAFYTLPYEEEEPASKEDLRMRKPAQVVRTSSQDADRRTRNQRARQQKDHWRGRDQAIPPRPEDSGYLSTDSNDSFCPGQITFSSRFSRIPEKAEGYGSQNSETEESFCDGASESGAESIATDSFFYGNFKKARPREGSVASDVAPFSLRLSDVEVNSDTERHCLPIMVRP